MVPNPISGVRGKSATVGFSVALRYRPFSGRRIAVRR